MPTTAVTELLGIYNANGSLLGELRYVLGKLTGRAHCGLCDITHAGVRRRPGFTDRIEALAVPFRFVHLDERPADVVELSEGIAPCVLAQTTEGWSVLVTAAALDACAGDPDELVRTIRSELDRRPRWLSKGAFAAVLARQADPGLADDLEALAGEMTDELPWP